MTRDSLGWRAKFAVVVPSTNTSVQPEYEAMRPPGVTLHTARIAIPNLPVADDAGFLRLLDAIRAATMDAVDSAMSLEPDDLVLGMSAETFWDGADGAARMLADLQQRTGLKVVLASQAVAAALETLGTPRRLAILTPYMPVGDARVQRFFEELGYRVVGLKGLCCASPVKIAHETPEALRAAALALDGADVDAIVQVGTNLAFAAVAAELEAELGKPVIAINTATWWHALRQNRITDSVPGFGRLLSDF
jgi:maleate isomerase